MSSQETIAASLSVENIGGIESTQVSFEPGITVLPGRNATNRTSLLKSIMGAVGSGAVSLKADADEGEIELEIGDTSYRRHLERRNGTVVTNGEPYLSDASDVEQADLFAFLLESNEARRAVARNDDLHDLLMRPVDTTSIEHEINQLVARRENIDEQLEELDALTRKLPSKETRRQELRSEIEAVEDELEAKRTALQEADESIEARREERSELDDRMSELEGARADLTHTRQRIRTEEKSVESLENELQELQEELEALSEPIQVDGDIDSQLNQLRDRNDRLESEINDLQSIIQFNEKMLDGGRHAGSTVLERDDSSPTKELLPDEEREVACWTCGSQVEKTELERTLETFQRVRSEKLEERSGVGERIDELQEVKRNQRELQRERRRLERRIGETEDEIAERQSRIEDLRADLQEFEARVEELEAAVRAQHSEEQDELLDINRQVNELEFERDQLENDLEEVEAEIDAIEERLESRETLEAEREEIGDELEDLRTRIERIEEKAVEQFNEHMEQVLDILGYDNLDRVWIERKQQRNESEFDLHVIRTTEAGTAYEDRIDHLSESEREVVGLVFALAGYLVHDVHETVPFLLLDSLEALDADRISSLVDYFGEYAENLVVALLPEDAAAVDEDYQRIREI